VWVGGRRVEGELISTPALTISVLNGDLLIYKPVETKCQPICVSVVYRRKHHPGRITRKESLGACCKKL